LLDTNLKTILYQNIYQNNFVETLKKNEQIMQKILSNW